jgi:3-deoxy-D-manno-octulosonate 8-phosphate phosphatase (KDO 8-P phosphatase)
MDICPYRSGHSGHILGRDRLSGKPAGPHCRQSAPFHIFPTATHYGVLYPLQTFSGHKPPVFSEVCLFVSRRIPKVTVRLKLENLARAISPLDYKVSSDDREFLHLAAVFACNFSNHMYVLASEIAERAVLPFEMFHSLIRETAEKAVRSGPLTSQTGPAVRNDKIIIKKHLNWLSFSPELRSIYEKLTESICIKAGVPAGSNNSLLNKKMGFFKEELTRVKAFVFDVDGVFSEGILLIDSEGDLIRSMNVKDGYAMQLAARKGYPIAIITGGNSEPVRKRFNMLGVYDVYLGSSKKLDDFTDFCNKHKLAPEDILYMGDDLPDYPVMEKAGFPACPSDAVPEIKQIAGYISGYKGGHGCVRDVIEQVLRVHGVWMGEDTFLL